MDIYVKIQLIPPTKHTRVIQASGERPCRIKKKAQRSSAEPGQGLGEFHGN